MERVDISILGRDYSLACAPEEKEALVAAVQHVAQLMQKNIRKTDRWVARYGGDEFIICLPGVAEAGAHRIANRLRVAIISERFPMESGVLQLSCSFGVQSVEKSDFQMTALMLLKQADEKLYQAKNTGRNKVF